MTALVVGATGATGRLLVSQLLDRDNTVRAVVRSADRLPEAVREHPRLEIVEAPILDLDDLALRNHVRGCDAVASCLGHTLSLRGIWGPPRKLVRDAVRRLCSAIRDTEPQRPVRVVLMNTTGNRNRDLDEKVSLTHRGVVGLVRLLVPTQADNEQAAEVLRVEIGRADPAIEWVVVRPDSLIDEQEVSAYDLHPSPIRDPIFDPGKTSRINVAHFMADLATDHGLWEAWKGRMPVIYNRET